MSTLLRRMFAPSSAPEVAPTRAPNGAARAAPSFTMEVPPKSPELLFAHHDAGRGSKTEIVWRAFFADETSPFAPSADDHARLMLLWLQDHRFLMGHVIPASDLKKLYTDFCRKMGLPEKAWQSVAASLNRQTGRQRRYRRVNGRNVSVYPIPRKGRSHSSTRKPARHV